MRLLFVWALAGALAAAAAPAGTRPASKQATRKAAVERKDAKQQVGGAAVRATVDRDGRLREPEIEERGEAVAPASGSAPVTIVRSASGGLSAEVPDELFAHSVATTDAQGKIRVTEVRGSTKAHEVVRSGRAQEAADEK